MDVICIVASVERWKNEERRDEEKEEAAKD
jgi:malate/lactate dehydrogenase